MKKCPQFYQSNDGSSVIYLLFGNHRIPGFQEMDVEQHEGAGEKHLPVASYENHVVTVSVGSVHHPMTSEHGISWVWLQTEHGSQCAVLEPGKEPIAKFALLPEDKPCCVYAYCNQHGLWKTKL